MNVQRGHCLCSIVDQSLGVTAVQLSAMVPSFLVSIENRGKMLLSNNTYYPNVAIGQGINGGAVNQHAKLQYALSLPKC